MHWFKQLKIIKCKCKCNGTRARPRVFLLRESFSESNTARAVSDYRLSQSIGLFPFQRIFSDCCLASTHFSWVDVSYGSTIFSSWSSNLLQVTNSVIGHTAPTSSLIVIVRRCSSYQASFIHAKIVGKTTFNSVARTRLQITNYRDPHSFATSLSKQIKDPHSLFICFTVSSPLN